MIKEKASVFIDGGYLARILKDKFNEERVNLGQFGEAICQITNNTRLRTYYYTCEPVVRRDHDEDIKRQITFQKFLSTLRKQPRFEVKLGRLQYLNGMFKQKMVDVLMSLDIANMSFDKQIQHIILIAGDSDFVPAVKLAKTYGAIIHLFYHPSSIHNELLDNVDERYIITPDLINEIKEK